MMKYAPAISLGLSLILGVAAFLLLRGSGETSPPNAANSEYARPAPIETREVLVVRTPVDAGEIVTPAHVDAVDWPVTHIPADALTSVQVLADSSAPMLAQSALFSGEPLLGAKIAASPPRAMLSREIPDGMRAISIAVTLETGVSGFVLPGDHVDLTAYAEVPGRSGPDAFTPRPLLQNVLVLAIDQIMGQSVQGAYPSSVVTLALSPDDAIAMTAVARNTRIGLSLIGQDEIERLADGRLVTSEETAAVPVPVRRAPRPRTVTARAPAPARPATSDIRVVHGIDVATVTAPEHGEDTDTSEEPQ